jgi:hypothetical protein
METTAGRIPERRDTTKPRRKKRALVYFLAALLLTELLLWRTTPTWEIDHTLAIEASPDRVWRLLADFEGYASWNTYTPHVTGKLEQGAIVRSRGHLGSFQFDVNNVITELVPGRRFCWRSQNWYGFLVWGTRCRVVEPRGDAAAIHHHELFEGPLAWLVQLGFRSRIERGIETHDRDLKRTAEASPQRP